MTDFMSGGDPANPVIPSNEPTSFKSDGALPTAAQIADDNTVVFEHGGRKFTRADLVKKLDHSETHIQRLTAERVEGRKLLDEVNVTLGKQVNAAELLRQIKEGAVIQPQAQEPAVVAQLVTADTVAAQVVAKLQQDQLTQQRDSNFKEVQAVLTNTFGDSVNKRVQDAAVESGITVAEAIEMARSKPKVFLKLFPELTTKVQPSAVSRGTVNTQSFQEAPSGPSGYTKATSDKAINTIYQARLKALGL